MQLVVSFLTLNLFLFIFNSPVIAEELILSGNGSESNSQISVSSTSNTQVSQSNQANIQNEVSTDLNTGENSVSQNTEADTTIKTGDISSETNIQISANTSLFTQNCCTTSDAKINISQNGTDSTNIVDVDNYINSQITINQSANIKNTIEGSANTGRNEANYNSGGNILIKTGDIGAINKTENMGINLSEVSASKNWVNFNIKITNNGSGTKNLINVSLNENKFIDVNNNAYFLNNLVWLLNTGENNAFGNTRGDVSIQTGNIKLNTEIENGSINISSVNVGCCNQKERPSDPGEPSGGSQPKAPPISAAPSDNHNQTQNNLGSNVPSGGQVLAAVSQAGQILPATGSLWVLILTLISVLMFLLGIYLRLHPGRDPSFN